MSWYRLVYRAAYWFGWTPWDQDAPAAGLVELIEGPSAPQPGRALDIGCGSGNNSIYLSTRGFEVTAIDMVERALSAGRKKAARVGASVKFTLGDATRLADLSERNFSLIVDVGCLHTLPAAARDAYVRGLSAIAADDATLYLFGFSPRKAAPMPVGLTEKEVQGRLSGWQIVSSGPVNEEKMSAQLGGRHDRALRYFAPWQFILRKSSVLEAASPDFDHGSPLRR